MKRPILVAVVLTSFSWFVLGVIALLFTDLLLLPFITNKFKTQVEVANYIQLPKEQAIQTIQKLGLKYVVDSLQYSSAVPKDHIIRQKPEPFTRVKKGRRIWLLVSKGNPQITVPKLRGTSVAQAQTLLEQIGLKVGTIHYVKNPNIPKGAIYRSMPKQGEEVSKYSEVNIYVSSNKPKQSKQVSSLVGWSFHKAKKWLKDNGHQLTSVNYIEKYDVLPNTIVSQTPFKITPKYSDGVHLIVSK